MALQLKAGTIFARAPVASRKLSVAVHANGQINPSIKKDVDKVRCQQRTPDRCHIKCTALQHLHSTQWECKHRDFLVECLSGAVNTVGTHASALQRLADAFLANATQPFKCYQHSCWIVGHRAGQRVAARDLRWHVLQSPAAPSRCLKL